ncbi:MAG: hypothetical protein ACK5RL_03530 [Acidimicrobiales bacterium]
MVYPPPDRPGGPDLRGGGETVAVTANGAGATAFSAQPDRDGTRPRRDTRADDTQHPLPDGRWSSQPNPSPSGAAPVGPQESDGPEGTTSARFVLGAMAHRSWLIVPLAVAGAVAAYFLGRSSGSVQAVTSVPMALDHVDWSQLEAEHQWNEQWVRHQLPQLTDLGSAVIEYREPDSLQITSFSLEATADSDEEAQATVATAAQLLIDARAAEVTNSLTAEIAPIDLRIGQAEAQLAAINAQLGQRRADQQQLADANADEIEISAVVGDVWALETQRNTWQRELVEGQAARSRIDAELQEPVPTTVLLGDPLTEASTSGDAVLIPMIAGGLIGLWAGAVLAYLLELNRGRFTGPDHPRLRRLGVPVTDLGRDELDPAAALGLYQAIGHGPVTLLDTSPDAGSEEIVAAVPDPADADLAVVGFGADDQALIGSRAVLVASVRQTRVRDLVAAEQRCRDLGVPVDRVVLTGDGSRHQLHNSARHRRPSATGR